MVLHAPISVLISVPILVMIVLLTPLINHITNPKNLLNYVTSSIGTLVSTPSIILKQIEFPKKKEHLVVEMSKSEKCLIDIFMNALYIVDSSKQRKQNLIDK